MRLLYISNQRLPTEKAYGIQIAKMCEAFARAGVEVTLLIPSRDNPIQETIFDYYGINKNFTVKKVSAPDFYFPGNLDKIAVNLKSFISALVLCWHARNHNADIVYSRDEWPVYFLSFFKNRVVFEAHKISRPKLWIYKFFIFMNVKMITTTNIMREEFIKIGVRPENLNVEHDGVDLSHFGINNDKDELRRKLGLAENKKIVGYVGHLTTMGVGKGVDDLLKAMKILQKDDPDIQLVIVGGTERDIAYYKKQTLGIDVVFAGHKNHELIPNYLRAFDVLAMPFPQNPHYARYMSPIKMFEYMASGRPIVATKLPSVEEVLNESNSVLVEPNSPEDLAKGIRRIIDDSEFGLKISSQALKDVQFYTWQKRAERIKEFVLK